jgi:hypothetical protein
MIIDITLLRFLIYISRFRRQLGPRIERWIQDGVWQLQRRAYEGEGQRDWTGLEGEIPLTDNGQMLKDMPILWVPGKSPMVMQSRSFGSTDSQEALTSPVDVDLGATSQGSRTRVKRWYTFGRR